ncbi:MAG: TonB-dependent receptor, partial [Thermoanaerobaculia bacterium]
MLATLLALSIVALPPGAPSLAGPYARAVVEVAAPTDGVANVFQLLDHAGKPLPQVRVSVVGKAGSVATDGDGRFRLDPLPPRPFDLAVSDQRGTWLGVVRVEASQASAPQALRLPATETAEVIVRAGLAPATPAPPAAAPTVLSRVELDQRLPGRLGNALESIPGLGRQEEGQSVVPTIRGMARSRVMLLLDDAPITAERRAGPSAGYLDPFSLENIEVVRGPGSVIYGSDALGGVIHSRTPMPRLRDWGGRFALFAGGGGDRSAGVGLEANLPIGPGALLLQGHQRSFDDYEDPNGRVDNSAARDRGLLARALLPVGSARIWAGVQLDEGRDQGKPALDSSVTRAYYPLEDSARFTVGADLGGGLGFTAFEIRAFYGTYRLITDRVRRPTSTVTRRISESDIDAKDASLRLTALRTLGNGTLRVGFDGKTRFDLNAIGRFTDFDSAGQQTGVLTEVSVDNARRTNLGLFAETEQVLIAGRLNASLGLRGDSVKTRNNGGFFGDRETSNGAFSGFLALTVFPATRWSVTAQYSRGFRDPLLSDRYFRGVSGRGFVIGNPDISPERSNQWDLAVRTSVGPVNLAAYGYLYRIVN